MPLICRSRRMESETAACLYKAMRDMLPIQLEDLESKLDMQDARDVVRFIWINLGCDRFSANPVAAESVWEICSTKIPRALPHLEYCMGHGFILAKGRAVFTKKVNLAISSFTKWMMVGKNCGSFAAEVSMLVAESPFTWHQEGRPDEERQQATYIKQCLFADCGSALTRRTKDGTLEASVLSEDLDDVLSCRHLTGPDAARPGFAHWCEVVPSSNGSGIRCCQTEADALTKTQNTLVSWATGRPWALACDSRWTSQQETQRRAYVLEMFDELLAKSLHQVRVNWGLHRLDFVQALGRMLENDKDNFSARNQLRLHRICSDLQDVAFCSDENATFIHLAVSVTFSAKLDLILFDLLGKGGVKPRSTLQDMLHPSERSAVFVAHHSFMQLLLEFSETNESWALVRLAGMGASSRLCASRACSRVPACSNILTSHGQCLRTRWPWRRWRTRRTPTVID